MLRVPGGYRYLTESHLSPGLHYHISIHLDILLEINTFGDINSRFTKFTSGNIYFGLFNAESIQNAVVL